MMRMSGATAAGVLTEGWAASAWVKTIPIQSHTRMGLRTEKALPPDVAKGGDFAAKTDTGFNGRGLFSILCGKGNI
jgi:hypothetical protein